MCHNNLFCFFRTIYTCVDFIAKIRSLIIKFKIKTLDLVKRISQFYDINRSETDFFDRPWR